MLDCQGRNRIRECINFDLTFIVKFFQILTNTFCHRAGSFNPILTSSILIKHSSKNRTECWSKNMILFRQTRTVPVEDTERCACWTAHCRNSTAITGQKKNTKEGIWTWISAMSQLINLIAGLFLTAFCPSLPLIYPLLVSTLCFVPIFISECLTVQLVFTSRNKYFY